MIDVCLILEGTFPYVVGGVSNWVNDLIRGLPDLKFGILHISPTASTYRELKYPFPKNMVSFKETYLFGYHIEKRGSWSLHKRQAFNEIAHAYGDLSGGKWDALATLARWLSPDSSVLNLHDLVHSESTWNFLLQQYHREKVQPSFIDYFWTWRLLHLPLIQMFRTPLPEAAIYHTISTGYAGLMASIAKVRTGRPVMLTEHGIYTRERKIEIFKAGWIYSDLPESLAITSTKDFFRDWWIRLFVWMSRITYHHANPIITLFEYNRQLQIEEGADEARTHVIPNGVVLEQLAHIPRPSSPSNPPQIYLIGRVVPIKDIKTFIKAIKELTRFWPRLEAVVAGPTDEDITYYQDCEHLVQVLNLSENIRFLGRVNIQTAYSRADIIVLTSISEAQPLVVLEANACGIPVVATDVGACREMIDGGSTADRELGPSGMVVPPGNPIAVAEAIRRLAQDLPLYRQMSWSGRQRVRRYYRQDVVLSRYQSLYESAIEKAEQPAWRA